MKILAYYLSTKGLILKNNEQLKIINMIFIKKINWTEQIHFNWKRTHTRIALKIGRCQENRKGKGTWRPT